MSYPFSTAKKKKYDKGVGSDKMSWDGVTFFQTLMYIIHLLGLNSG